MPVRSDRSLPPPQDATPSEHKRIVPIAPSQSRRFWEWISSAAVGIGANQRGLEDEGNVLEVIRRLPEALQFLPDVSQERTTIAHTGLLDMVVLTGLHEGAPPKPPPPQNRQMLPTGDALRHSLAAMAIASAFGMPIVHRNNWRFPSPVTPVYTIASAPPVSSQNPLTGNGALDTAQPIGWHGEILPSSAERPAGLMLYCIEGDPCVSTLALNANRVIAELPDDVLAVLRQPRFYTEGGLVEGSHRAAVPVVIGGQNEGQLIWDSEDFTGTTPLRPFDTEAVCALMTLRDIVERLVGTAHSSRSGEVVFLGNYGLHGRSVNNAATFSGQSDRYLLRVLTGGPGVEHPFMDAPTSAVTDVRAAEPAKELTLDPYLADVGRLMHYAPEL